MSERQQEIKNIIAESMYNTYHKLFSLSYELYKDISEEEKNKWFMVYNDICEIIDECDDDVDAEDKCGHIAHDVYNEYFDIKFVEYEKLNENVKKSWIELMKIVSLNIIEKYEQLDKPEENDILKSPLVPLLSPPQSPPHSPPHSPSLTCPPSCAPSPTSSSLTSLSVFPPCE
jgi:hypothetical protein